LGAGSELRRHCALAPEERAERTEVHKKLADVAFQIDEKIKNLAHYNKTRRIYQHFEDENQVQVERLVGSYMKDIDSMVSEIRRDLKFAKDLSKRLK